MVSVNRKAPPKQSTFTRHMQKITAVVTERKRNHRDVISIGCSEKYVFVYNDYGCLSMGIHILYLHKNDFYKKPFLDKTIAQNKS